MISLRHNFAFVHVNKAGGTSVTEALAPFEDVQPHVLDHDQATIYRDYLGRALWAEMFSFAFIRNPWDRMVSSYEFRRQYLPDVRSPHVLAAAKLSFREWMLGPVADDPRDREWSDQLWMVCDHDGSPMVSQIYLYEDLIVGFADACHKIGIETPALGEFNKTDRADYRDYYDAETDALVRERFSRDLAWAEKHHPGRWVAPVIAKAKRVKRAK
jgi:chondroitin 4-sulfotransferase 11